MTIDRIHQIGVAPPSVATSSRAGSKTTRWLEAVVGVIAVAEHVIGKRHVGSLVCHGLEGWMEILDRQEPLADAELVEKDIDLHPLDRPLQKRDTPPDQVGGRVHVHILAAIELRPAVWSRQGVKVESSIALIAYGHIWHQVDVAAGGSLKAIGPGAFLERQVPLFLRRDALDELDKDARRATTGIAEYFRVVLVEPDRHLISLNRRRSHDATRHQRRESQRSRSACPRNPRKTFDPTHNGNARHTVSTTKTFFTRRRSERT